jgi:hypothetical protein
MRPSISSAIEETFGLWMRHWKFFVVLGLFLSLPGLTQAEISKIDPAFPKQFVTAGAVILGLVLQAVGMAATLSLLRHDPLPAGWVEMVRGVQRFFVQLLGVQVLILFLGLLLLVPILGGYFLLAQLFGVGLSALWLVGGDLLFLIFLKYALADPLVVVENLKADTALAVSWRMTRNRFGFVFGCYLLVGILEAIVAGGAERLFHEFGIAALGVVIGEIARTYWYALPWVMYLRIKAGEEQPTIESDRK